MMYQKHVWFGLVSAGFIALGMESSVALPHVHAGGASVHASLGQHGRGTDILHLSLRASMSNTGLEPDATGNVSLSQNEQGNANNQRLSISASGLETNNTYLLFAALGDDTNLVFISDFDTDDHGDASLQYVGIGSVNKTGNGNGQGNGNGHGHGQGKGHGHGPGLGLLSSSLLNPLSDIREIGIFNGSTQAVLTADLPVPDSFQYLVKRDLSANDVQAFLRINASTGKTQFRLDAAGLNPTSDYFLVLNGGIVQTNSTDANGRLKINSLLENPPDILQIYSLALWDDASNSVVSTELP